MKSVAEQIKEKSIADAQAVQGLSVYKVRMRSDEGWYFFTARTNHEAKLSAKDAGYDAETVVVATHLELIGIAARALTGL